MWFIWLYTVRKPLTVSAGGGIVEGFGKSIVECTNTLCLFIIESNQEWQNLFLKITENLLLLQMHFVLSSVLRNHSCSHTCLQYLKLPWCPSASNPQIKPLSDQP